MEYKNVDEVINKLMLSYSSLVGLISRAMENDKGENSKNTGTEITSGITRDLGQREGIVYKLTWQLF